MIIRSNSRLHILVNIDNFNIRTGKILSNFSENIQTRALMAKSKITILSQRMTLYWIIMMCRQTDYSPISREGLESGFASSVTVSFKRMNSLVRGCLTKALFTFTSMRFIGINYNPLNQLIVDPYHHTSVQLMNYGYSYFLWLQKTKSAQRSRLLYFRSLGKSFSKIQY